MSFHKTMIKLDQPMANAPETSSSAGLTLQLSSLTALQILFAFGVQAYTVLRLGAGVQTDALTAGYTVPQVVMVASTDLLSFVLVPLLAGKGEQELKRRGWELFLGFGCIFMLLSCVAYVAIPPLISLLVPGFGIAGKQLAVTLARIQVFSLIGAAEYAVLSALYQVRSRFLWPVSALLIAQSTGMALLVWKLPQFGIYLVAWIQLFLSLVPALLLLPVLGSIRNFTFNFSTVRQVLREVRPLCLGAAYFKTAAVPDRILGSFLAPGSIVILDLANRTYGAIERILNQGIVTPVVPPLVRLRKSGDWTGFCGLYRKKLIEMFFSNAALVLAVFLAYTMASNGRAMSLLARMPGSLGPDTVRTLAVVFVFMSGRLLFSGLNHTLTSAFYAAGDWTTPTKITAFTYTVGLIARVAGFFLLGLRGIALAASLFASITFIALNWRLRVKCKDRIVHSSRSPATIPQRFGETAEVARIAQRIVHADIQSVTDG
jgi:peptidoglycan biosynthesis protein MviN/MurJ (putative lipid II flippase)